MANKLDVELNKQIDEIVAEVATKGMIGMQLAMSDGSPKHHKKVLKEARELILALLTKAEARGYGRGTVDTLEHVKAWADKTEVSYNDMMSARLASLTNTEVEE